MTKHDLTEREEAVLNIIIRDYVINAEPEGSRTISKKSDLCLSPASIRNILADLEDKGYLNQPHTSAGRVPTEKGYRYYVDNLIEIIELSNTQKQLIRKRYGNISGSFEEIASVTSSLLASTSKQLGVFVAPKFYDGTFRRLDIIEVASNKIMLVLTIKDGLVNSIFVEINSTYTIDQLQSAADYINEKLAGKKLSLIKDKLNDMTFTDDQKKLDIIRVFVKNADSLFDFSQDKKVYADGTSNMLSQPEFFIKESLESVIELVENKNILVHFFNKRKVKDGIFVTIGGENEDGQFKSFSILTSSYKIGDVKGALGIIGPTRMAYPKLISIVDYMSNILSDKFSNTK